MDVYRHGLALAAGVKMRKVVVTKRLRRGGVSVIMIVIIAAYHRRETDSSRRVGVNILQYEMLYLLRTQI